MASADYKALVQRYLDELQDVGEAKFREEILDKLKLEEKFGEVTNESTMDESTTVRRSVYPIEIRIKAAYEAIRMFNAGQSQCGGISATTLNFSNGRSAF